MDPTRFKTKFGSKRNLGLFYLIAIALVAAIAAGAFQPDEGVLLFPVLLLGGVIVITMFVRKIKSPT